MFTTASEPHGPQTENIPLIRTLSSSSSFSLSVRPVKTAGFYSCPSPSWIFTPKTGNLLLRPLCSAKHRVQLWGALQPVPCSSHPRTEAVGHEQALPPDLVFPVWGWVQFEHHWQHLPSPCWEHQGGDANLQKSRHKTNFKMNVGLKLTVKMLHWLWFLNTLVLLSKTKSMEKGSWVMDNPLLA